MVPQQRLSPVIDIFNWATLALLVPEQPRALVAHDEVNALDLAVDQNVLLDELALDLVRKLLHPALAHVHVHVELVGRGGVQQLLALLGRQLAAVRERLPILLLLLLLANL
jgi:hypothetical protein